MDWEEKEVFYWNFVVGAIKAKNCLIQEKGSNKTAAFFGLFSF